MSLLFPGSVDQSISEILGNHVDQCALLTSSFVRGNAAAAALGSSALLAGFMASMAAGGGSCGQQMLSNARSNLVK